METAYIPKIDSLEITAELLKQHDIRPSLQRLQIYRYIKAMKNHPTIETIYQTLLPEIPSLSKTTIYNTLKLFVGKGIIQPVTIEENEMRYDADIKAHIHFKCSRCGEITDFFLPDTIKSISSLIPNTYKVEEEHMYVHGVCQNCSEAYG